MDIYLLKYPRMRRSKSARSFGSKTFRIFVSPTFSDFKEERNALQRQVFPRLRELCAEYDCRSSSDHASLSTKSHTWPKGVPIGSLF